MKNDLVIIRGGYRHVTCGAASELTGYSIDTIHKWVRAGAVTHVRVREGRRERVLPAEEDVVQVASMSLDDLHDAGIRLTPEAEIEVQRRCQAVMVAAIAPEVTRSREPWEVTEIEVLTLPIPLVEMAKRLGRSYSAVVGARKNYLDGVDVRREHHVPAA